MLIHYGLYLQKITKPKYIYGELIDSVDNYITNFVDNDIKTGNNLTVNSTVDLDLTNANKVLDFNSLDATILLQHDKSSKAAYMSIEQTIPGKDKTIFKYLVKDATQHVYLNTAFPQYINRGKSDYFESLLDDKTVNDNIDYLHSLIIESLKNNLSDEYFEVYDSKQLINGKDEKVKQISLKIDRVILRKILTAMEKDLKNDVTYKNIFGGTELFNMDFTDYIFLEKDEVITINLYTSPTFNKIRKYEIIYVDSTNKKVYNYVDGEFNVIEGDRLKYTGDIVLKNDKVSIKVNNPMSEEIGYIKFSKDGYNLNLDGYIKGDKEQIDITYTVKFSNVTDDGFDNERHLTYRKRENNVEVFNYSFNILNNINKTANITEEIGDAKIYTTLSDEEKQALSNKIKEAIYFINEE